MVVIRLLATFSVAFVSLSVIKKSRLPLEPVMIECPWEAWNFERIVEPLGAKFTQAAGMCHRHGHKIFGLKMP